MNQPADTTWITFRELIDPIRRRWRLVLGAVVGFAGFVGVVVIALPRPYEASTVLATVVASSPLGSFGPLAGAAAAFGGLSLGKGDLSPTPELISALTVSRKVLTGVGTAQLDDGRTLVEAMTGAKVPLSDIPREMRRFVRTDIGAKTGLVTVIARHRDSAIARRVGVLVIERMTSSFVEAARAQARGQRLAQEERLDSARRQVANAETAYRGFLKANRVIGEFSGQAIERDRLSRDVDVARQVYLQATGDREAAVARELQQTPAVVIIDPAPEELPKRPRRLLITILLAGFAGFLVGVLAAYLREAGSVPASAR